MKAHRKRAMDKMQARSLAELVKMIERLDAYSALRNTGWASDDEIVAEKAEQTFPFLSDLHDDKFKPWTRTIMYDTAPKREKVENHGEHWCGSKPNR